MSFYRVKFDDSDVLKGIAGIEHHAKALQVVFKKLRPDLRKDLRGWSKQHSSPSGAWPVRSPATMARLSKRAALKKTGGRLNKKTGVRTARGFNRMLNPLGKLPASISMKVKPRSLVAASPVAWATVHNEGGVAGRGSHIPSRPFLFLSDAFLGQAEVEFANFVTAGWDR